MTARATRSDAVLAVVLAAVAVASLLAGPLSSPEDELRSADALGVALALAATLPVAVRRALPLPALGVAGAAALAISLGGYGLTVAGLSVWISVGWTALHTDRRTSVALSAVSAAAVVVCVAEFNDGGIGLAELLLAAGVGLMPPIVGDALRRQRELTEEVRRLERGAAERAVDAERVRIARDVHDTVGHHLAAIGLTARAGTLADPREALETIAGLSDRALEETRHTLGVLRGAESLRPTPRLDDVRELAQTVALSGVQVDVALEARTDDLPDLISTCAFRVVQEALTNTAKHAAPARARLLVRRAEGRVQITVSDDGTRAAGPPGRGHGLTGMRERVQSLGGSLLAAPQPGSGWRVHAELPDHL